MLLTALTMDSTVNGTYDLTAESNSTNFVKLTKTAVTDAVSKVMQVIYILYIFINIYFQILVKSLLEP